MFGNPRTKPCHPFCLEISLEFPTLRRGRRPLKLFIPLVEDGTPDDTDA